MPRALVTGATGQVGAHVVQRLRRDGWDVIALVRDAARAGALSRAGITLATGDTLEATGFARAARGCDVIFHAAAAITPRGGWEAFRRPNVEGTRNAIGAAASAAARLVHVSSVAVYGGTGRYAVDGTPTGEDSPFSPLHDTDFYGRSKRESEALVIDAHERGTIWATAVRPDVIYGTHDRQFVPRMARLLRHGLAPLVGGGTTKLAVVHAANVADGMVRAAVTDAAGGRAFNLANDFDVTVAEFLRYAGEGLGTPVRTVAVPYAVARAALGVFGVVARLRGKRQLTLLARASLDFISRDNPFTSERARHELGWNPEVRPERGVVEAFRWWSEHH